MTMLTEQAYIDALAQDEIMKEMLTALKCAEIVLASYSTTRDGIHYAALEQARAAIAKAEAGQ